MNKLDFLILSLIVLFPGIAYAASSGKMPQTLSDLIWWLFGLAIIGVGYFFNRQIKQNDQQHNDFMAVNRQQWRAINRSLTKLEGLSGEHRVNHGSTQNKGEHCGD